MSAGLLSRRVDQIGRVPANSVPRAETAARRAAVAEFVCRTFRLRGTLSLHRSALGRDLLIAPLNVALAPVFLIVRFVGLLARWSGASGMADCLDRRRILLPTTVSRRVEALVRNFIEDIGAGVSPAVVDRVVADYVAVRSAVAEITTTLLVVVFGFVAFGAATPGVISLSGPVSEMLGHASAVADFPLGRRIGELYYGVFAIELPLHFVIAIGIGLAALASLITTFAGIVADPLQVALGIHQRRLARLLDRLETEGAEGGLSREHVVARLADAGDFIASIVRAFRP